MSRGLLGRPRTTAPPGVLRSVPRPAVPGGVLPVLLTALVTALLAALVTAGLPGAPAAASTTSPTDQDRERTDDRMSDRTDDQEGDEDAVTLRVDAVGPQSLVPGSTLVVRVTVTNAADEPADLTAQLSVRRPRLSSRSAVEAWAQGTFARGAVVVSQPLGTPLAPGESRTLDLSVPADDLALPDDPFQWGPRGVEVSVAGAGGREAVVRTFTVWEPAPGGYEPTRITVLVPVVAGPPRPATGLLDPRSFAEVTGEGGRLRAVLDAAAVPGVSWAVDPAVVDPALPAAAEDGSAGDVPPDDGDGGTQGAPGAAPGTTATQGPDQGDGTGSPDPTAGDDTAGDDTDEGTPGRTIATWQQDLAAAVGDREVVALPYGDPDTAALVHAGLGGVHDLAEQRGDGVVSAALRTTARTDVAWPVSGSLDESVLTHLLGAGRTAVVLSAGAQPLSRPVGTTTTGRSVVDVPGTGAAAGLLVDTGLSTVLGRDTADTAGPGGPDGPAVVEDTGPAGTAQRLLAETAALTLERPFDPRHVLVTAPRDWAPQDGDLATRALTTAPWLQVQPLGALLDSPPPDLARGGLLYPATDRDDELSASVLRRAAAAAERARDTASVLDDPVPALADADAAVVAASSAQWRERRGRWLEAVSGYEQQVAERAQAIRVLPGSSLNVVSSNVSLPVTVVNGLDADATVRVQLRPRSQRLVAEETATVQVPAGGQRRVTVPVRAVGNGDTDVLVQLLTPSGEVLGEPVTITVRVRADWETRGTLVIGAVVAVVLLVGLVRAIRRGRRRRALTEDRVPTDGGPEAVATGQPAPAQQPAPTGPSEPTSASAADGNAPARSAPPGTVPADDEETRR
ncbi:DUF6049 family protein [Thalassiella azotivora]